MLRLLFPAKEVSSTAWFVGQRPVVLMGRGHSGTRVLCRICTHLGINMGASGDSASGDVDDKPFQKAIKRIALHSLEVTRVEQVEPAMLRRFQRAAFAYYTALGKPTGHWGWKFPETYLMGPCVAAAFPGARLVHLVRDGRDVAFKLHLTDDPTRKLGRAILKRLNALQQPHHVQAAVSWAYQVEHFENFRSSRPEIQVLDVVFRDLCAKPEAVVERLCAFLEVPMTDACRRFINEGIDATKIAQHREMNSRLVREVEDRIRPTLRRYACLS